MHSYNLAYTQSLKNSTIPEGGAKGTILPELDANPRSCFEKYVDSILDLVIPGRTPGVKEPIVDLLKRPEQLFFGPDEGTADMMDVRRQSRRWLFLHRGWLIFDWVSHSGPLCMHASVGTPGGSL